MAIADSASASPAAPGALPYAFLTTIFAVNLLAFLNFVGIFVAMVSIAEELDAPTFLALQLPVALYVAVACAAPATPWLLQRFGARRLLLYAITGMLATTVAAAVSENFWLLLVILFIHGLFCAPISPASQSAVSERMGTSNLGVGMAVWGAGNYASYLIGPLIAGWIVDQFSWHWIMLLPLPFALLALPLVRYAVPPGGGGAGRADRATVVLAPLAILLLLATVSLGPALGWFASPYVTGAAIGFAVIAPLYVWSYRRVDEPSFRLSCLADPFVGLALMLVLFYNMLNIGMFQVEFLGQEAHLTTGLLGVRTAAGGGGVLLGFVFAGWLSRHGLTGATLLGGIALGLLGKAGFLGYGAEVGVTELLWTIAAHSVGFGMVTSALATLAYRTIDQRLAAHVATGFILAIYLGASLGAGLLDEVYLLFDAAYAAAGTEADAEFAAFHSEFWVEFIATALLVIPALLLVRRERARARSEISPVTAPTAT